MKQKENDNVPTVGYGPQDYEYLIEGKMSVLRARLLNLADTITDDKERREAIKGLIKDFCSEAYYPLLREIEAYLTQYGVLDGKLGHNPIPLGNSRLGSM